MSSKYPTFLADLRIDALGLAERAAESFGRGSIRPNHLDWASAFPELDLNARTAEEMQVSTSSRVVARALEWVASGMPVYRLDVATATALMETSVRGIQVQDLQLPFESFFIFLDGAVRVPGWAHWPGGSVRGVWVYRHDADVISPGISKTNDDGTPWGHAQTLSTEAVDKRGNVLLVRGLACVGTHTFGDELEDDDARIVNLVASFALYIQTSKPTRSTVRHRKLEQKVERARFVLPREWVVVPADISRPNHSDPKRTGTHVTPRAHVVRGHWRMQAYGPNRSMRKPLWIQPHWRGDFEPGITRDMRLVRP